MAARAKNDVLRFWNTHGKYRVTQNAEGYGLGRVSGGMFVECLKPSAIFCPNLWNFEYGFTTVQLDANHAILIDPTGRILQEGSMMTVFGEDLVGILTEDNKARLYNPHNGRITEAFDNIYFPDDTQNIGTYFVTSEGEKNDLLTRNLMEVFKPEFEFVEPCGSCFIGTKANGTKFLGHPNWDNLREVTEVVSEANGFVLVRKKRYAFIEVETGRGTQFIFPYAENFNKQGFAKVEWPLRGTGWMATDFKTFLSEKEE